MMELLQLLPLNLLIPQNSLFIVLKSLKLLMIHGQLLIFHKIRNIMENYPDFLLLLARLWRK